MNKKYGATRQGLSGAAARTGNLREKQNINRKKWVTGMIETTIKITQQR